MLKAGIVGLPNVGKSTLFNALTRTRKAEAANYPFCTIEPNVGVVVVPDSRLEPLADIETIATELVLADLETVMKAREKAERIARGGDKEAKATVAAADRLLPHLNAGKPALTLAPGNEEEQAAVRRL